MGIDVLPRWERLLYWVGGIGSMVYCLYSFYRECQDKTDLIDLQTGIKFLGGTKDAPDPEWTSLCRQIPYLMPLLVGHVLIGQFLHFLQTEIWLQKSVRLLYDVMAIMYVFGVRVTLLCIVESLAMYLVTLQRHTFVVWIVGLLFTTSLNIEWMTQMQLEFLESFGVEVTTFFISVSYVHIRLISSCIEIVKNKNAFDKSNSHEGNTYQKHHLEKSNVRDRLDYNSESKQDKTIKVWKERSIIDYLTYIFYLPIFFYGPILTFDEFLPQLSMFYHSRSHRLDLKGIVKKICKIVLVASFIEIQSHFMFITSVQAYSDVVMTMPVPAVIGLGVWQGQYFHLKYLCLFGIGSVFYVIDGLTPIPPPACISWVYSFSDMWKYFDVGLYNFIKKYIYIPWGGSKAGFLQQMLGTVLAFSFVCYWHGPDTSVLVWCCGNLIIILLEITASRLENSILGSKWKSILGASNVLRLKGLVATPLYVASALQVMFFFFSVETGNAMVDKMILRASWKTLLLEFVGFYFAIQNAMIARKWVVGKISK